jgi:hypothetical protein
LPVIILDSICDLETFLSSKLETVVKYSNVNDTCVPDTFMLYEVALTDIHQEPNCKFKLHMKEVSIIQ